MKRINTLHKTNQSGFSTVEAILILVVVAILGFTGWFVWNSQKNTDKTTADTNKSQPAISPKKAVPNKDTTTQADQTAYVTVKEWGVRFKVPAGLTDVQYKIFSKTTANGDDQLAIYAKPAGSGVKYVSDYESSSDGFPTHALGVVYRSTSATQERTDSTVTGKKLGDYYYYTAWAFNSMATGAACTGLYGNDEQNCQVESGAFKLVNQGDTALLNTIELAK
ncbi:hypothetical protein EYC59_04095 [Candidatus Saccharibacteria bacterium]|nr:MAG: hypothetical protein EYC59_04095 [Candidatus Saccharibacteria bacterium]